MVIKFSDDVRFLAELYHNDAPSACLLAEYPSSNSDETVFQNKTQFIIHDPFLPPPRELLTSLGPHHLMCCWGDSLPVTSQVAPPAMLTQHWQRVFGDNGVPNWKNFDASDRFITLFPHQSISPARQLVDPAINYELHSKEVIEKIDCPQAKIFDSIQPPCLVKLSHGYAGLGNFFIRSAADETAMRNQLSDQWPDATLVVNSIIPDVVGDFGVQFYLRCDGEIVWLGLTEQNFNESGRWCGGTYSKRLQTSLVEPFEPIVTATAAHLHRRGYFGVVGVDILQDKADNCFLVDVNPRLTGITPFLMASRIFQQEDGFDEGIYLASFRFPGSLAELVSAAESYDDCRVLVLSAFENSNDNELPITLCHLSVSSNDQQRNRAVLDQLATT